MKIIKITIYVLLLSTILILFYKINEYQDIIFVKQERIEMLNKNLDEAKLSDKEKDKYIGELHESVNLLQSRLTTLEDKLKELSVFQDKLK
ncbi:hypothetical protein [Lysinibacillus fusiformis]|uniref:Uncharacterized protein n=1 Tax=Lysinibacillus fusiformis TaxID=28031 RepID=A0A1E4QYI8_9BACI|nr:hypothetical protein [Lysinibacillus fusiformis]ODV53272.1 hypothetical protein BG258_23505 [Lysinibacillus fusiformis]